MGAGKYRQRVILQSPAGARDAVGERTTTWSNVATVWANVRPLTGREQIVASQRQQITDHVVEVRYSSALAALDASWRVLYGSRVLTIDGAVNADERKREFILYCTESERTE